MFKRIFIVVICFCSACADLRPIDITNPSQEPAVLCDMTGEVAYADGISRKEHRQLLIYPNADLRSLEVAFTGSFRMRQICREGDVCEVEHSGKVIRITVKPGEAQLKISPNLFGHEEIYEFDQAKKTIAYQIGGGMDSVATKPFVGTCKSSPKIVD
ncbi:hypothetical protein [Dyella sp.]|uniref:hypothetical protein n=1 Tax=Dyella sp. TaxID=1869338 RepID=UPI002B8423B3|nr:hypothetical protein [Dyella sp.]HTC28372.1 hypothetical protein [Dyella sp.]